MQSSIIFRLFLCLALFLLICNAGNSQSVSQWRGADRKGVYHETSVQNFWPPEGPVMAWVNGEIGNGFGSPVFHENQIFLAGEIDSTAYLFALDLKGNILWKTAFEKEWTRSFPGSRMTPTIHEGLIYVSSGMGNLACVEMKTGVLKWLVKRTDLHGVIPMHGHSESPLIEGEMVFFMPGGKDTNVVALNRFTGKIIWICKGRGERPAYNSPLLVKFGERSILVVFSAYSLLGIDAKTGELLWVQEQINTPVADRKPGNGDTHCNTVWYEDGFIYYIAGDGNGAVKLALEEKGKSVRQVWRNSSVDNYMGGFIIAGEKIYTCSDSHKSLFCLDTKTGIILDSLKCGTGNIISDGKFLYYYNQKGDIHLINPDKGKMEIVSYFRVPKGTKEHFSHPVIEKGILYIRHGKALMAYKLSITE
ncbi:MAG: PQQ-binding-like beta-propeller repeat protein [Bacteroidetes bacterium]|nr:PQQ-binding-like beta-propeller repeat protein [Bacteroidota bacterium]